MGNQLVIGKFFATLSRSNEDKDKRHDELWLDFISKVKYLSKNAKYREILLDVDAGLEDD